MLDLLRDFKESGMVVSPADKNKLTVFEYHLVMAHDLLVKGELRQAMSFPSDYRFCGSQSDVKRQIGNAVCPKLAEALLTAVL